MHSWLSRLHAPPDDVLLNLVFILIPLLGGLFSFFSSDSSSESVAWRCSLRKSALSPPVGITAPLWVILYISMGHASYLIYGLMDSPSMLSPCFVAYLTQCLLNHFFIIVLFGLQRIDLALLMIAPLWLATGVTTLLFYDLSLQAGRLMLPVFLWVSFNVYLNSVLYLRNPVYTQVELHCEDRGGSQSSKRKRA